MGEVVSGESKISAWRFRLLCEQRGYGYPDLARALHRQGVVVSRNTVARLGTLPDSPLPRYSASLAKVLKTTIGYLTGTEGQFMNKRFRELYRERGYVLASLASQLYARWHVKVSEQYLQQLASGKNTNPREEIVDGLAALLATSPDYLTGSEDARPDTSGRSRVLPPGESADPVRARLVAARGMDGPLPSRDLEKVLEVIAEQERKARGGSDERC